MKSYEYVVIGSGAGGAPLADILSEHNKDILIIDKGEKLTLKEAYKGYDAPRYDLFTPSSQKGNLYNGFEIPRIFGVGGTTLVALGNAVRTLVPELDKLGIKLDQEFDEIESELEIAKLPSSAIGERSKKFFDKSKSLGLEPHIMPKMIDTSICKKCGKCNMGCAFAAKKTSLYYIDKAMKQGAHIESNTEIDSILKRNSKYILKGRKEGEGYQISSKNVIVSAGALATPIILANSNIDVPMNLFVDPFVTIGGYIEESLSEEIQMSTYVSFDNYIISPYYSERICNILIKRGIKASRENIMGLMIKIKDDSIGSVTKGGISKILTSKDVQNLSDGIAIAAKILNLCGITDIVSTEGIGAHPGGTAPIGITLDNTLRTKNGIYVCDASVLPVAPGAPPILTIMALSKRLGTYLINKR
ncbi:MAG: GMC family oxidoreductase N-terminal domain-containing protein [Bacteroidales bacterium]|jgi:choline dehydrogenase-like flavoprotein|nr:GMC family oxidoreductase N-terminal domain-containing protein [Bacteroidales bacterium]